MKGNRGFRLQFLPAFLLLGLVGVLITTGFVILSGMSEPDILSTEISPPAAAVPNLPTESLIPTITQTASQTPKPTWTLQPSTTFTATPTSTRTSTATRIRIPTLTPARPYSINERYDLTTLTPERMDQIVRTLAEYPDAKFYKPEDRIDPVYHSYFIYPYLAYKEALLRFPSAAQVNQWNWGLAYSLAHLGDPQAVGMYTQFITRALNQDGYAPLSLPAWFSAQTADLSLQVHTLDLPANQGEMYLLEIQPGNVLYLLYPGQAGNSSLTSLSKRFEFLHEPGTSYLTLDLDGDGKFELAVSQMNSPGGTIISDPLFYNLDNIEPQPIALNPTIPVEYKLKANVDLRVEKESDDTPKVLLQSAVFYPACPFSETRRYKWDASLSATTQTESRIYLLEPDLENLAFCDPLLTHAEAFWPLEARLEVERALLPFWPPETDSQGRPYPASAQDELRFNNAITLALIGFPDELQESIQMLQDLQENPTDPDSPWSKAANEFHDQLGEKQGLYLACQGTLNCDLRQAFIIIVEKGEVGFVFPSLQSQGVTIRTSGSFDFDQDGTPERWLTLRPRPNEQLEFWILVETESGAQAVYVDQVEVNDPQPFWADPQVYPGVFQIKTDQGYRLLRWPQSEHPYLETLMIEPVLTTYTRDAVFLAEETLLSGESTEQVQDDLLTVLNSGRFNCINHRICDRFWYALGLAYELSGDLVEARDTYIKLWWENSASPITALARMKLDIITPTPTPSRTPTHTPTVPSISTATQTTSP